MSCNCPTSSGFTLLHDPEWPIKEFFRQKERKKQKKEEAKKKKKEEMKKTEVLRQKQLNFFCTLS